jgi:hypothetical protein
VQLGTCHGVYAPNCQMQRVASRRTAGCRQVDRLRTDPTDRQQKRHHVVLAVARVCDVGDSPRERHLPRQQKQRKKELAHCGRDLTQVPG